MKLFLDVQFGDDFLGTDGALDYAAGNYTVGAFRADSAKYKEYFAENPKATYADFEKAMAAKSHTLSNAFNTLHTVEGWVEALSTFKADTNGIAWEQTALTEARKDSADAQIAFDKAKADWQILVDAINGKKTTAPTDSVTKNELGGIEKSYDIETAIADYNEVIDSLNRAVTKHNNAIDTLKKYEGVVNAAGYDKYVADAKAGKYLEKFKAYVKTNLYSAFSVRV